MDIYLFLIFRKCRDNLDFNRAMFLGIILASIFEFSIKSHKTIINILTQMKNQSNKITYKYYLTNR